MGREPGRERERERARARARARESERARERERERDRTRVGSLPSILLSHSFLLSILFPAPIGQTVLDVVGPF